MDSEEPNNRSSSVSNLTRESTFRSLSPTQSPPIQLMERPDHYEFEDECNSPTFSNRCSSPSSSEWSSLSNESLFSIHITNSLTHDHYESMKSDELITFSSPMEPESDFESSKLETSRKLDVPKYNLDEPQKVVRWKTQVERLAEEGAPPEGHKWQPSPFNDHKSNEPANHTHTAPKPKKKLWWSWCKCSACNMPKWSCWNGCCKKMKCSNCKPKKVSSHSSEASGTKKPSRKGSRFTCFGLSSCSCHCCEEANLLTS